MQVERRAADHLEHIRRRGLLRQRFLEVAGLGLQLLEQAAILDGNDGLVGEGLDELDLAWRELAPLAPRQRKPPDPRIPAAQRDAQNRPIAHQRLELGVIIGIGRDVADVHHLIAQQHPADERVPAGRFGQLGQSAKELWLLDLAAQGSDFKPITLAQKDGAVFRANQQNR